MATQIKNFIIRGEHREALSLLSKEQKGELLDAMFTYNLDGEEPEIDGMVKMAFAFIKNSFDADREAYEARCEKNRQNGKRGGRPRKPEEPKEATGSGRNSEEQEETDQNPENPMGLLESGGFTEKPKKAHTNSNTNSKSNTNSSYNTPIPPQGDSGVVSRDFSKEWEFLRKHWNSLGLPEYKKLFINLQDPGQVKNWMNAYSLEELTKAITNYRELLPIVRQQGKPYDTLYGFIRSGVDRFHDGARPAERYKGPVESQESLEESRKIAEAMFA